MSRSKWCEHKQLHWIGWEKGGCLVSQAHLSFIEKWRSMILPARSFGHHPSLLAMSSDGSRAARRMVAQWFTWSVSALNWFWIQIYLMTKEWLQLLLDSQESNICILDKGRQKLTRCLHKVSSSRMVLPLHSLASYPRVLGWPLLPCEFLKISSEFLWFNYPFFCNKMLSSQNGQAVLMTEIRSFFMALRRNLAPCWMVLEHFLLCVLYRISVYCSWSEGPLTVH